MTVTIGDIEVKGKEIGIDRQGSLHEGECRILAARTHVRKGQSIQEFTGTRRMVACCPARLVGLLAAQRFQYLQRVIDLARAKQVLGKRETTNSPNESRLFGGARIPPGKRVRGSTQRHGRARLFHPAEGPQCKSQRAIDIRMAVVPRQGFEQGHGIGVFLLRDQYAGPSKARLLVRPQGAGTLKSRHGFAGAIQIQQPSPPPEPGRRVVGIDLDRALEVIEGYLIQPLSPFELRAKVRPAEVFRVEGGRLSIADQRFFREQIVLVRHGQATPHQTRGRQRAGVLDHPVQELRKILVRGIDARDHGRVDCIAPATTGGQSHSRRHPHDETSQEHRGPCQPASIMVHEESAQLEWGHLAPIRWWAASVAVVRAADAR